MFKKIIQISINNKWLIIIGVLIWLIAGIYSIKQAIDVTSDNTNNQV